MGQNDLEKPASENVPDEKQKELEEIGRELAELEAREQALEARRADLAGEEPQKPKRMRDNLYDKIPFSVDTMNKIIIAFSILLVVLVILGIVFAER